MLPEAKSLLEAYPDLYQSGFGLYAPSQKIPLPLTKVDIVVDIFESTAKVRFTQTYVNATDFLLETEYFFPIPADARFDSFLAKSEDKIIKGVIKRKEVAKEEYKENLQKGNTVAYSEISTERPDIMKVLIGNITPAASIQIEFSYIQELSIVRNRFYEFIFRAALESPQQKKKGKRGASEPLTISNYPIIKPEEGHVWNIEVNVKCRSPITYIDCTSHKTTLRKTLNPCESSLILVPTKDENVFNKNFRMLLSFSKINVPTYRLAKNEERYYIKLDFLPRYIEEDFDDAIRAATQCVTFNPEDITVLAATGEFIFLIDRSGSMSGKPMQMAKQALLFALKSLPPNSFFNIYSFGSTYHRLYSQSVPSTESSIADAIRQVERFQADLGGTEIYDPIFEILMQKRLKKHPKTLFLLTDGEVSDPTRVVKLIGVSNHVARVFTLGIGSGCSRDLVKDCAKAGGGSSEFVKDPSDITGKVVSLLEAAFTPICDDFRLEFSNQEVVKLIAPAPESMTYILRNQKVTFYILLSNDAAEARARTSTGGVYSFLKNLCKSRALARPYEFEVTLKNFDTGLGNYRSTSLKIDLRQFEQEQDIIKLATGEISDILEKKDRNVAVENLDIFYAVKNDIHEEIIKMSIENQVLTRRTAFICEVEEANPDAIQMLPKQKVIIPQLISVDPLQEIMPIDKGYKPKPMNPPLHQHLPVQAKAYQPINLEAISMPNVKKSGSLFGSFKWSLPEAPWSSSSKKKMLKQGNFRSRELTSHQYAKKENEDLIPASKSISLSSAQFKELSHSIDSVQSEKKSLLGFFSNSARSRVSERSLREDFPQETYIEEKSVQYSTIGPEREMKRSRINESMSKISTSENAFFDVIQSQKTLGYWEPCSQYYSILLIDKSTLLKEMPKAISVAKENIERIAITIALLIWIERHFASKKPSWNLIHKKGVQWLKSLGLQYAEIAAQIDFI